MPRIPRNRNRLSAELAERKAAADRASKQAALRRKRGGERRAANAEQKVIDQRLVAVAIALTDGAERYERATGLKAKMALDAMARQRRIKVKERGDAKAAVLTERLTHGDIETYRPKEFIPGAAGEPGKVRELPPVSRARLAPETLWTLHARGSINREELRAGRALADACDRAWREQGAINLDSMGGGWNGGLCFARCNAFDDLTRMWQSLPELNRPAIWQVLVAICGKRLTLREYAGGGGRACMAAGDLLYLGLGAMARATS